MLRSAALSIAGLVLSLSGIQSADARDDTVRISAFSGKPVPRFETLRYGEVRGREGPSEEYPVAFMYRRAGLPVLVIKETAGWTMVRDPDGDEVWMASRMLSSRDAAMVRADAPVALRRQPNPGAAVIAQLGPGLIVSPKQCEGGWCRVEVGRKRGWLPEPFLWGTDPSENDA